MIIFQSVDDDDYWETSKVSKLKTYGINQFDENTVVSVNHTELNARSEIIAILLK